jgi:hypothetical protein
MINITKELTYPISHGKIISNKKELDYWLNVKECFLLFRFFKDLNIDFDFPILILEEDSYLENKDLWNNFQMIIIEVDNQKEPPKEFLENLGFHKIDFSKDDNDIYIYTDSSKKFLNKTK